MVMMRSRFITIFGGLIGLLGLGAYWRWSQIRRLRRAAPAAHELLREHKSEFTLEREGSRLVARWKREGTANLYLRTSPYAIPRAPLVTTEEQCFVLEDAALKRHWGELRFDDGTRLRTVERHIPLSAVPNFRDIGGYSTADGYTVRWEQVYRASAFDNLNEEDSAILDEMGIKLVCDLRTAGESLSHPDKLPESVALLTLPPQSKDNRWLHMGRILFQAGFLENLLFDAYTRVMLDENPQVFKALFEKLADSDSLPLVIHCAIGKDRTGIAIALLLSFLGVDEETILTDYALSNHHYEFFRAASAKVMVQLKLFGMNESDFDYLLIADSALMRQALSRLHEKYGSAEAYLLNTVGLSRETLAAVRGNLLE
jgi:protein-tyrosine phosphatase